MVLSDLQTLCPLRDGMFPGEQKREAPASRGQKWTVRQVPA